MTGRSALAMGGFACRFPRGKGGTCRGLLGSQPVGLGLVLCFLCQPQRLQTGRLGIDGRALLLYLGPDRIFALFGRFEVALCAVACIRGAGHDFLSGFRDPRRGLRPTNEPGRRICPQLGENGAIAALRPHS